MNEPQTREELIAENSRLKAALIKEMKKEICYRCGGSGKTWTYWDGDTSCPHCHGVGRV